jgi:hypothetical protein
MKTEPVSMLKPRILMLSFFITLAEFSSLLSYAAVSFCFVSVLIYIRVTPKNIYTRITAEYRSSVTNIRSMYTSFHAVFVMSSQI